jgi:hypothetical protein
VLDAADYLAAHIHEASVWIVPCLEVGMPTTSGPSIYHAVNGKGPGKATIRMLRVNNPVPGFSRVSWDAQLRRVSRNTLIISRSRRRSADVPLAKPRPHTPRVGRRSRPD